MFIERRFTREGSSAYKIYSGRDGDAYKPVKVVSTRRKELDAICDHMNIQVDNPLNILTQDNARMFLSASNARDKYKFFMEGTQLQQLNDQYSVMVEKIDGLKVRSDCPSRQLFTNARPLPDFSPGVRHLDLYAGLRICRVAANSNVERARDET